MQTIIESEKSNMNFMTAVSACFKKYATFSGRARRSEYWYFFLFCTLVSVVLGLIFGQTMAFVSTMFTLATLVPSLAVTWRRMHDIGKCGAWSLIVLIPVVGAIIFLIWTCKNGEEGENEYGENPKGE